MLAPPPRKLLDPRLFREIFLTSFFFFFFLQNNFITRFRKNHRQMGVKIYKFDFRWKEKKRNVGSTSIPVGPYSVAIVSVFSLTMIHHHHHHLSWPVFLRSAAIDRLLSRAYASHLAAEVAERLAIRPLAYSVIQYN